MKSKKQVLFPKHQKILEEVKKVVSGWREFTNKIGISRREQELMATAFRC